MEMKKEKTITAYKGFNEDLSCRDFKYEVGKEYEIAGEINMCRQGFHACENPLEVFDYYDMNTSRFCEVELSGDIKAEDGSSKICASKISIKAELKFSDIIKLGVDWLKEVTSPNKIKIKPLKKSSGDYAKIGSSGDSAQIGSSGDYAQIGSSGDSAKIGSSGDYAVILCAGCESKVKAKKGSWITLAEWDFSEAIAKPVLVKTEFVDGERIKEDTYYQLKNGEFTEIPE